MGGLGFGDVLGLAMSTVEKGTVLMAITLVTAPIAAIVFARSGPLWRSLGKGPLAIEQELPHVPRYLTPPEPAVDGVAQEEEVRQMLEAKSERQRQRGERPLDVEVETARLLQGPARPAAGSREALRQEIRQFIVVRNERRLRRGQAPLDVEAEVERELGDFS